MKTKEEIIRAIMDTNRKIGLEDYELYDLMLKSFNQGIQEEKERILKIIEEKRYEYKDLEDIQESQWVLRTLDWLEQKLGIDEKKEIER